MFLSNDAKCMLVWEFIDKGYIYPKITCKYKFDEDCLYFELSGAPRSVKPRKYNYILRNFKKKTALDAVVALERKLCNAGRLPDGILPRHEYDCIMQVYYDLGLDLGFIANPLREVK